MSALLWSGRDVFGPGSIFYPYYVASSLALAFGWLASKGVRGHDAVTLVFARETWIHRSVLNDFLFCVFYMLLLHTAVVAVESKAFFSTYGFAGKLLSLKAGARWAQTASQSTASQPLEAALATLVTMVAIDFASYATHWLLHRIPLLWRVHRLHHSASRLTPFTTYRQHPLEPLILYGARGLAAGLGLAIFYRFFPRQTPVITIAGLGAGFFIYMFTVNLHHFPVPVRYPRWLRAILVSPHVHHIHHSAEPRHQGRNLGVVFSFWDRIFGTLIDEDVEPGELKFGLAYQPPPPPVL